MSQSPSVSFPASPPPLFHIRLIPISLRLGYMNASFHHWRNCHIFDTRRNCDMWWISASKLHIVRPILVSVQQKQERERWVQTFLVVKGRNLQLSNKSLRLNPFCDWLRRATWHTLYEHELYAVVYSPFLPLYRQQTKQGHKNLFFFRYSKNNNTAVILALTHVIIRLPDRGIFGTVAASTNRCLRLSPPEAIKPRLGREKGSKPAC